MRPFFALLVSSFAVIVPPSHVPSIGPSPAVSPVVAGPPWISIEHPVNPYDQTTRDAFLVVNAYHHGTPVALPVSGTAEGLVNGQRRSVTLAFTPTSRPGAFALKRQWPTEGTWTLAIAVSQGEDDKVWAIVDLASDGAVSAVRVPTRKQDGWMIPAKLAMSEIDAALRVRAQQVARK